MSKNILVCGGAGYIGSHMIISLIESGYNPIVLDNFSKSSRENINTIQKEMDFDIKIIEHDVTNSLSKLDIDEEIEAIINFSALKAVGESVEKPLEYYSNNIEGTLNLLKWATMRNIKKFIFSSTAAIYGNPEVEKVNELTPPNPLSPYAWSKYISEQILRDSFKALGINSVCLRYFNVAGNSLDGSIGELSKESLNLLPSILLSHLGIRPFKFKIFGNDYPTRDGTGIRDYIHVLDLVKAHLNALEYLDKKAGSFLFNLGTGNGTSVKEIINAFQKVTGEKLDFEIAPRRDGDPAICLADSSLAKQELNWEASLDIESMISSMWKWYKKELNINS